MICGNHAIKVECTLRHLVWSAALPVYRSVSGAALIWLLSVSQIQSSHAGEVGAIQSFPNRYCRILTYIVKDLSGHARATVLENEEPVIYLDAFRSKDAAYSRFLLAHECCHHTRGHLKRLQRYRRQGALLMLARTNHSLELDADCCAATILREEGDEAAIKAGQRVMEGYGVRPTGRRYPAGLLRASVIGQCGKSN